MHILVVDDEEAVRSAVKRRLEREGFQVDQASDEDEADEMIRSASEPYDIIVTDMVMNSEQAGVSVLKSAFSRDVFAEVIVLTAYGNVANAVECMKLGAADYVEKNIPGVDVYDLLALKVGQSVERRRTAVATIRRADAVRRALE